MEYHIFISHAWRYSEHYEKIVEWLDDSGIIYRNYSVPSEKSLDTNTKSELKAALTTQIRPASCVLMLGGMYASYSDWIEYELDEAVRMGKYIIGIRPWGQERMPTIIQDNADVIVGWNASSVIDAIQESN